MTLGEILGKGSIGLVILMTLIQVSPIKINPWSWIAESIGGALNKKLFERFDRLEKEFNNFRSKQDEQNAVNARSRILRFGDEVLCNQRHTKEHFEQILLDIDDYEQYTSLHPNFRNNKTVITSKRIKEIYEKQLADNDFL